MLTYRITPEELPLLRFGISPLGEMSLSLRSLLAPTAYRHSLVRSYAATPGGAAHVDVLATLVNEDFSTPDFLTPRPESPQPRIRDQLADVVRTPTPSILAELDALWDSHRPHALRGPGWSVRSRVMEALEHYWSQSFARFWVEHRSILAADVRYRATHMADHGLAGALATLSPHIRLAVDRLAAVSLAGPSYAASVAGRGLVFVPSFFTLGASYPVDPTGPPMVIYPARGQALAPAEPVHRGLHGLLSASRADLLDMLDGPTTTRELAASLGKTEQAVNQQLQGLRTSGVVEASRSGRCVLYRRTEAGDVLLRMVRADTAGRAGFKPAP
ncbi:DUF5937 family protein [Knoellia locipacati]|uniref:ArsR family transcriptional regulator n=1 Tax=Knoellia locipacati TaxID=882824 RepID=A0A512T2S3_9MICO|nr:DUF5937 family protein [Knoellia locipacati]GEQ14401.1 ArsR family transcriptional regulator [Knoellia locipacati]